jgi:hypothetical protein
VILDLMVGLAVGRLVDALGRRPALAAEATGATVVKGTTALVF